ncbi:DUF1850 domain-containing protein [Paracoccus panacisoli]|uniref:DUF1850 domain-containing protein n=1 Tax=Paracoccus panacisoli TaxID=1510163 RepID=A0ABV6T446_9RHOB
MSACLMAGAVALAVSGGFSLGWTHSVERVRWEERWRVEGDRLVLIEARVRGSGAGMEPGEGAVERDGWWVWQPSRSFPELTLAASGATGGGWTLCTDGGCRELGAVAGAAVTLRPCPEGTVGG